jgi:tetratricopeptide (TPR) repeat protein
MLVSKSIVTLFGVVVVGTGAALAWQVRMSALLKAAAAGDVSVAELPALEHQVATQARKLEEAETRLSALLKTAEATRARRPQPGLTDGTSSKREGPVSTDEIAQAATEKGRVLMKEGKLQEALDLYMATYREVQPLRPGSSACQRMSSEMKYLGRTFPPALTALAQLRDDAMRQLQAQPARQGELSFEIALLNERLAQGDRTLALFDALPPGDMGRGSLAMVARDAFIQARRYPDALLGKAFGQMLVLIDSSVQLLATVNDPARQAMIRKSVIEQSATNIEVLAGAGKASEAEQLTKKLLAFDDSQTTEALVKQHLARAEGGSR